jgi:hypothetical protein
MSRADTRLNDRFRRATLRLTSRWNFEIAARFGPEQERFQTRAGALFHVVSLIHVRVTVLNPFSATISPNSSQAGVGPATAFRVLGWPRCRRSFLSHLQPFFSSIHHQRYEPDFDVGPMAGG